MTPEIPQPKPLIQPPSWWHDALRNNLAGNLMQGNRFVSFPIGVDQNTSFVVISQEKNDDNGITKEGIYIETTIPEEKAKESQSLIMPILVPIKNMIAEEAKKLVEKGELADHESTNPELASLGASFSELTAIKIAFAIKIPEHTITLSIHPVDPDELKNNKFLMPTVTEKLLNGIFSNSDIVARTNMLFRDDVPASLKIGILTRESLLYAGTLDNLVKSDLVKKSEIEAIDKSALAQKNFSEIMSKIEKCDSAEAAKEILISFSRMTHQEMAGWIFFYSKFWKDKFTDFQKKASENS